MAREQALGVGALLFSVAIWANFLVTTGGAVDAGIGVVELGMLRAFTCAAALSPVIWRMGLYPKGLSVPRFMVMVLGGGVSFMFLMPYGFSIAPASDSGIFAPGALPLWVAILSFAILGEQIGPIRLFGFLLIAGGIFAVGGYDALTGAQGGVWLGYACYSGGSFMFACYAIAQRGSGLNALEATALVALWSVPIAIGAWMVFGADFSALSIPVLAWTALTQFASGVVAVVTYTYGVIKLGPSRGSAFIALTPAVVALASDFVLGQKAPPLTWVGVAVVSAGVLIASGIFERRRMAAL